MTSAGASFGVLFFNDQLAPFKQNVCVVMARTLVWSLPLETFSRLQNLPDWPMVHIINQSPSDEIMPKLLKIAKVIPVYKGQETTISGNYRPISLLSMFEKLIERVMCNRLKRSLKYFI